MTFDSNGHWVTNDQTNTTWYRDYGDYLAGVMRIQSSLLSQIGFGQPTQSIKFYTGKVADGNSKYIQATNDAGGALALNEDTFTVSLATYNRMDVGMQLKNTAKAIVIRDDPADYNGPELLKVSSKTIEGGPLYTIHVIRDYGHDTAGETLPSHGAGATYEIMNYAQLERSVAGRNNWFGSDQWSNVTQIFRKDLAVSGSYEQMHIMGTSTQSLPFQIQQMTEELQPEFLSSALYGKLDKTYPEGTDSVARTTQGIFDMVAKRGGTVSTATVWEPAVLDTAAVTLETKGAIGVNRDLTIYVNPTRIDATYAWERDMGRRDAASTQRGGFVKSYVTPRGYTFNFFSDPYIGVSDFIIGPPRIGEYIKWRPLGTRKYFSFRYQNPGEDGQCAAILSEMGLEGRELEKRFVVGFSLA
jgi:hypothetical protein